MSLFAKQLSEIQDHLYSGSYEKAALSLSVLKAQTVNEHRIKYHYTGILKMRQGDYKDAILSMQEGLQKHGPNISLLLDLSACYYLDSQMYNWSYSLEDVERQYFHIETLLSDEKKVDLLILIGKFNEEKGLLVEALKLYQQAIELCQKHPYEKSFVTFLARAQAQVLRLKCQYNSMTVDTNKLYQVLSAYSASDSDYEMAFEIQHALLLAEVKIFDFKMADARFENLKKSPLFSHQDKILIYSDLLFEKLAQDSSDIQELIKQMASDKLSAYEELLLALSEKKKFNLDQIQGWINDLAPAAFLRCVYVLLKQSSGDEAISIKKMLNAQLLALPAESKKIWNKFFEADLSSTVTAEIYFNSKTMTLIYEGQELDLSKQAAYIEILELFIDNESLDYNEIAQKIWGRDCSESEQARLKMRIHRLNDFISKNWLVKSLLKNKNKKIQRTFSIKRIL